MEFDFLQTAIKGDLLQKGESSICSGVAIDSRKEVQNKVFFALKGPHFDGHDFLHLVLEKGARIFVVSDQHKAQCILKNQKSTVILVPDTLKALQNLASLWTQHLKTKVIAVTGSNGKTSTCFFAQTLFSSTKAFASPKSYNNQVGVPLSMLQVNRTKAFLIQEIGTSTPGEIAFLTSICAPVISIVTMVGPSHLQGLGNIESVAQEKQDIYLKSPNAVWIFNKDNPWTKKMFQELSPSHPTVLTFSYQDQTADVHLRFVKEGCMSSTIKGHIGSVKSQAEVLFSGQVNIENLMSASALALSAKIDPETIWKQLPKCRLPEGRQEWFHIKDQNISILFDAYNANPSSMASFLQSCRKFSKPEQRLLIIGDMKELGTELVRYHKELACQPAVLESRFVALIGEHAGLLEEELNNKGFKGTCVRSASYDNKVLSAIKEVSKQGDFIGIKASRSLKLERLFFDLTGRKIL